MKTALIAAMFAFSTLALGGPAGGGGNNGGGDQVSNPRIFGSNPPSIEIKCDEGDSAVSVELVESEDGKVYSVICFPAV